MYTKSGSPTTSVAFNHPRTSVRQSRHGRKVAIFLCDASPLNDVCVWRRLWVAHFSREVMSDAPLTVQYVEPPDATHPSSHAVQGGKPLEPYEFCGHVPGRAWKKRGWIGCHTPDILLANCDPAGQH